MDRYLCECRDFGFDTIEISAGFISLAMDDWLRLVEQLQLRGLRAKPELGVHYGPEVNLFVDHSQIVQLEALRAGLWGPQSLWGRVVSYRD